LRSENRESRHAAESGQMAWSRIVAYKSAGSIDQRQQLSDGSRRSNAGFSGLEPPALLIQIAGNLHAVILFAQTGHEVTKSLQRPDAHRLARAGMHKDLAVKTRIWEHEFFTRRQLQAQGLAHHAPVFVAMRPCLGPRQRLGQKHLTAHPRKTE